MTDPAGLPGRPVTVTSIDGTHHRYASGRGWRVTSGHAAILDYYGRSIALWPAGGWARLERSPWVEPGSPCAETKAPDGRS